MYKIKNTKYNNKNIIFFNSFFNKINIFFLDKIILIPKNIKIKINNKKLYFKSLLGKTKYFYSNNINLFLNYNKILLNVVKQKKKYIFLYNKIIKKYFKGILQGFKFILILKGLSFKYKIENNKIFLKLGFSHYIIINIPNKIKIINKQNKIIFFSIDYIFLTQFIFYLKNLKKINIYKKKGLLLQNEKIFIKEGKKNKK